MANATTDLRDAKSDALAALPAGVLAVRRGPGANCSSIGSIVDVLFGAAVVGGALYALIAATLAEHERAERARPPAIPPKDGR